jgi:hypothetical protein
VHYPQQKMLFLCMSGLLRQSAGEAFAQAWKGDGTIDQKRAAACGASAVVTLTTIGQRFRPPVSVSREKITG